VAAVILRDKFKCKNAHEKIQNIEMYWNVYRNTTKNDMNIWKGWPRTTTSKMARNDGKWVVLDKDGRST